ncbi:hypothetical protein BS78_01G344100 [Paspalum vaginatum]|nr:hypothetical protein BS78_01G344100 [Paspalum vaginatum]
MVTKEAACVVLLLLAAATTCQAAGAGGGYYVPPGPGSTTYGLKVGYYRDKCPPAEAIVRRVVRDAVRLDPGVGAGLIRMLFHDCFVEGCDASVLLDPTPANPQPEKLAAPNNPSLRGFEVIDAAKAAVERACPGAVSCADIVAFAARDASAVLSRRGLDFDMPAGRLDGRVSSASRTLGFLPPPTFGLSQLVQSFAAKGLGVEDMVALSGAHTVGRSHCSSFVPDRIAAPSDINASFAASLRGQCPVSGGNGDPTVAQDAVTPDVLDNQYYKNVLAHRVLFTSDASLLTSPATAKMVSDNANIPGWWENRFKAAMVKMASVDVKTSNQQGEVRRNCRAVN